METVITTEEYTMREVELSYKTLMESFLRCCYGSLAPKVMLVGTDAYEWLDKLIGHLLPLGIRQFHGAEIRLNTIIPKNEIWLVNPIEPSDPKLNMHLIVRPKKLTASAP